jgi:hypothetical protein
MLTRLLVILWSGCMTGSILRGLSVVLAGIVVTVSVASAQTPRATVRGIVVDQTGARLGGVDVEVTREDTLETRRVVTDDEGRFVVAELPAGVYVIDVSRAGFSTFRHRAQLVVGHELWLVPELAVTATATITTLGVEASIPLLDRTMPARATLVDQAEIGSLPLDGRNFLELALLASGTAPAPEGSAASVRGDFAFSASGAREDFNNYILDGVYNIDPKLNTPAVRPPVDGIQEFKVTTSTYDASFGRNAAGQINVVTRSGSNSFAGTAYEFARQGAWTARNYFAPAGEPNPEYSRHQVGGSIGGPIVRSRTFFFADYEHTRLREGITRVTNVPTARERAGDFSQSLFPFPADPASGQPLPGGQLPAFFQNPIGAAIAALYPRPNRDTPLANYVSSPVLRDDVHQFDGKVEHNLPAAMRLIGRYSLADRRLIEPFAGPGFAAIPGYGNDVPRRGQNLALTLTRASSSYVNDLRFGFNRVSIGVFPEDVRVTNATVGLPSLSSAPRHAGLSLITVAGYSPIGHEYNTPQESTADSFQVSNTVTAVRGAHLLKVGGEWYGVRQSAYRDVQARGFLTFLEQGYTGNALADLLLGLPVLTGGARLDNPQNLRASNWGLFVHDDWRARGDLTISAGLRYDYAAPPVDRDDRASLYDFTTGSLVQVGTGGMPRGGFVPDRNNLAPRAGFAWTPDALERWVVRGGYGIYYNQGALATSEGLYFSPPYFNLGIYFPAPGLPPLTVNDPFPAAFPVFIPPSATAYQRDLRTPWMQHWNLGVQHQIGARRAVEVAYVGSRGRELISARDGNQAPASPAPMNLRPNPLFGDITLIESRASSRYDALQLTLRQRVDAGLSALASYTYGKSTDDASGFFTSAGDPNFPQNSLDPGAEHSRSSFDVRHRFSLALSYDLPFSGSAWVEGWQVHAIATLQSGRPFTVGVHPDIDVSNTGRANLGFGNNDRPNVVGNPALPAGDRSAARWFDTGAFVMPAFGTFGDAGRNILDGPGYRNVNLAIVRHVTAGPARLQLRLETFNLFNTVNLNLPDPFLGSPTFGQVLSAHAPRRLQLGVRAVF